MGWVVYKLFIWQFGLKSFLFSSKVLLGKQLWLHTKEKYALCRKVVDDKYGIEWNGWCLREKCIPYGVRLWKHFRRG